MSLQVQCPFCQESYRLSDEARGRRLRCSNSACHREFVVGNSGRVVTSRSSDAQSHREPPRVQTPARLPPSHSAWAEPVGDWASSPSEPPLARPVEPPLARPVEAPLARLVPTQNCPCCGCELALDAVDCDRCGTNLETGRRTIQARQWDQQAERDEVAASWLRWASIWLSPGVVLSALALLLTGHPVFAALCLVLGFMPIPYSSEAPIRQRPLALLLIVAVEFFVFPASYSEWWVIHFAMWSGDPSIARPMPPDSDTAEFPESESAEPLGEFAWYQLVTAQFLHGDAWHLAFNMALLLVLGPKVNDALGNWGFAAAYLGLGAVAGLSHVYSFSGGPVMAGLGASGSAMAIAGMYAVFSPQHRIRMVAWFRVFLFTPLFCYPFRIRGLWLILFMVAMDLFPILTNMESNVGHGVHFIGFVSGASVAAFLVALKRVNCGGYDLLSWCFGQEQIAQDEAGSRRATDTWTRILNHPVFMAAVMLMCAVSFVVGMVSAIGTEVDSSEFPAGAPAPIVAGPQLPANEPPATTIPAPELPNAPATPSTAPAQKPADPSRIVLSNGRIWKDNGVGALKFMFSVDYTIERAAIGEQFQLIIKPARGRAASLRIMWVGTTTQGSPGSAGSQGTLSATLTTIGTNDGPFEAYIECERWDHSGAGSMKRVRERVSDVIGVAVTEAPPREPMPGLPRGPRDIHGLGPGQGPGGLPGQNPGGRGGPGSGMPGGFPGGAPGGRPR